MAVEAEIRDLAVLDPDMHTQLIAAQRVVLQGLQIVRIELAEVPWALVVVEDVVAIQIVHGCLRVRRSRARRPARRSARRCPTPRCTRRPTRAPWRPHPDSASAAARSG